MAFSPSSSPRDDLPYDDIASLFDRLLVPTTFARPGRDLIAALAPAPGDRVLDVGAGTGAVSLPARDAVGARGLVVSLDSSVGMLSVLREKKVARLVNGSAPGLPFADRCFDGACAGFVISHFADYSLSLEDLVRVLRPGARLAVSTWANRKSELIDLWGHVAATFADMEEVGRIVVAGIPWDDFFSDPAHLEQALLDAGLEAITIERHDYPVTQTRSEYLARRENARTGRVLKKRLGQSGWQRFDSEVSAAFKRRFPDRLEYVDPAYIAVGSKP